LVVSKAARLIQARQLHDQGKTAEARLLAQQLEREYPEIYLLVEGRLQNQQGNFPAAERALRKAAEIDTASVDIQFELGSALLKQGKFGPAAECFRTIADKLEPTYGPAHLQLGHCWKAQGYRPAALQAYRSAVQYLPQNGEAQLALGELLAEIGQPAEAVGPLQHAVRLRPADRRARELLEQVSKKAADIKGP
jgi:tetratricopeptide (TPR) repeat protein